MPEIEPWTVGRLLQWTTTYLQGRGADSPRLDAEVLLAQALGCQRIQLYTAFTEEPDEKARDEFRALVRRRAEGAPVAYLVGSKEFYSLPFRVTPDVLIPRPETEFLVIRLLDLARAQSPLHEHFSVADIGTGSGVIAVCAARRIEHSVVVAVDVSPAAIAVAAENAAVHGVADRIEFVESDLFEAVPADRQFDFVVSNPPYVTTAEMSDLARDVREHEPRLALDGGAGGTTVIERLIPQAADRLAPGGWLLMEISPQLDTAVRELLEADGRFERAPTLKDLAGFPRVAQARRTATGA